MFCSIKGQSYVTINITMPNHHLYRDHGYLICKCYLIAFSRHFKRFIFKTSVFNIKFYCNKGEYCNRKEMLYGHTFTSNPYIYNLSIKIQCFSLCSNDNDMKYTREPQLIWIKLDNIFKHSMTKVFISKKKIKR